MADGEAAPAPASERFDEFFSETIARHTRAEAAAGLVARRFRIAGALVEMRFAGPALVRLLSEAFEHLASNEAGEPDFTIHIYDEESTGFRPGRVQWDLGQDYSHGEIPALIDDERYLQVRQPRQLVIAGRRPSRRGVLWLHSADVVAIWERAAPLLPLINWWAGGAGYFRVHGGAVGRPEGGVLIVGPGGAGKSHTAISCLDSDLLYAGDDHCLLGTVGGPSVASIYSTAKLFFADLHRFPVLERRQAEAVPTPEGKAIFFLKDIFPERLSAGFPIRAVLQPRPSGRPETRLVPGSSFAALLHLGPEHVLRWPNAGRTAFARLASALRSVPCYRIETGTDLATIPRAISGLLDSLT